jgi:uncharacterized protein YrrD
MQFKDGADVISADGEKIGEVNRVVVDPGDGSVTHIVVRKGFFFAEDRVIPIEMISRSEDDEIHLNIHEDRMEELPEFLEINFIPLGEEQGGIHSTRPGTATEMYWYPMAGSAPLLGGGGFWGMGPQMTGYYYPQQVEREQNIPEGSVALEEGAKVITRDGENVGDVSRIITESEANQVTHLVITKGLLNREKKLIPANWISRVKEDTIQLKVDSKFVERLRDYQED